MPPEPGAPSPEALTADFRAAMRGVAATIHVVTLTIDGVPRGMTATAVSSLSMRPPSLLVCMNEEVSMHRAMAGVNLFRVNVLNSRQRDVARAFSDSAMRDVRFATGAWSLEGEAAPRLTDAQASLLCRSAGHHRFGTHSIFLGEVIEVHLGGPPDPLVYVDGDYCGSLAALP